MDLSIKLTFLLIFFLRRNSNVVSLNMVGFLLLALECGKSDTNLYPMASRATPTTIGNQREQHTQPLGNKENMHDSYSLVQSWETGLDSTK
jgi:hypothetical protein